MGLLILKRSTDSLSISSIPSDKITSVDLSQSESVIWLRINPLNIMIKKTDPSDEDLNEFISYYSDILNLLTGKVDIVNLTDFDYPISDSETEDNVEVESEEEDSE